MENFSKMVWGVFLELFAVNTRLLKVKTLSSKKLVTLSKETQFI